MSSGGINKRDHSRAYTLQLVNYKNREVSLGNSRTLKVIGIWDISIHLKESQIKVKKVH